MLQSAALNTMSANRRITINLTNAEYSALSQLAERFHVSLAWLGRRALAELAKKYSDQSFQMPLPFSSDPAAKEKR